MRFLGIDLAWQRASAGKLANESGVVALTSEGAIIDAGWRVGLDDVVAWIADASGEDTLLFADAPLIVTNPAGTQRLAEKQVGQQYGRWHVSANSTNTASRGLEGVRLRELLEEMGWAYDAGFDGPASSGRYVSECYPYTTIVGAPELGYTERRPTYKRKPRAVRTVAEFRPLRASECDGLVRRLRDLVSADPPLDLRSHPVTRALLDEPSPQDDRAYKHREDLIDAVLCAWTAALWHHHGFARCQVLGDPAGSQGPAPATIIAPARLEQRSADHATRGMSSIRLVGPEIEVVEEGGAQRLVFPMDEGYSELWARLPESERRWSPAWGFHPDDDPDSYPSDAVF